MRHSARQRDSARASRAWTDADIPQQSGRTAVVTGATGGLGLRIAEVLASRGARVMLTSRDPGRGAAALERVAAAGPVDTPPELVELDVSSLASVRTAASEIRARTGDRVDLLVNNAGVMAPPLGYSTDGIEQQWATNVIGPAALTWLLLPAIESTPGSRVIFVSSDRHRGASFDEARLRADLRGEDYRGFDYYGRTKLADLLLSFELDRHFREGGIDALSAAAHPGFTATNIVANGFAGLPPFAHRVATWAAGVFGQPVQQGALPILYAATAPHVSGSRYFGPTGLFELRGAPGSATRSTLSRSAELGAVLVRCIEEVTGIVAP
ncbi:MAG: oxidoreductase, short-chain dehydrogenase/reductase family [Glaciihabitans sp.]|nr:oxidoreductase, short-chain dehydrogenase/reductase family [Glaciihabitans sp.]